MNCLAYFKSYPTLIYH